MEHLLVLFLNTISKYRFMYALIDFIAVISVGQQIWIEKKKSFHSRISKLVFPLWADIVKAQLPPTTLRKKSS